MHRFAAVLAIVLAVAVPLGAPAKKPKASPAPAGALSATPVTCPAADPAVWVNTTSKIYWAAGSEYYGKTKHGGYACTSAAVAMGARAPKASPIGHKGGAMSGALVTPPPETSTLPAKTKHHRGATAAPSPSP